MTETLLPDVLTPITPLALYAALRDAWPSVVGGEPARASLLVLLAQVGEETGWHACHCFNVGNVKHVPGDGRSYCQFRASEIVNGVEEYSVMAFRAFTSLEAGAADYLGTLHREFVSAWPAVLAGQPAAFVHAIKLARYFTGDEAAYTRNVVAMFGAFDRSFPPDMPPVSSVAANAIATASDEVPEFVHDGPTDPTV